MRHVCFASVVVALALVGCGSERQIDDSTLVRHDASVGDTTEGDPDGGGASDGFDLDADAPGGCMAKTCEALGANCGPVADGCGGILDCGKCTAPEACGGGGKANVCGGGGGPCVPKTCADVGADCGPIGDGCGGVVASCGTCTAPAICGGAGVASKCGGGALADAGGPEIGPDGCVSFACKQVKCSGTATTSISGVVYDPAGKRPLPNVFVFVPNSTVSPFTSGASCDKCAAALSGAPLVQTTTDVNGKFKLDDMPVDSKVPVVIQIGKWRRQITVSTTSCVDTVVPATLSRLPKNKSEGDIPKIALTTGSADPLECLLRKIGIDDSEFTNPSGTGRVNLFKGYPTPFIGPTGAYAAALGGATFPDAPQLWNQLDPNLSASPPVYGLKAYDVVLLGCEGNEITANKSSGALTAMQQYVNAGGRVFGSHYHYVWMKKGPTPWPGMATWNATSDQFTDPTQETVLTGFPKGSMMSQWMKIVGAASSATPSLFPVNGGRRSVGSIVDKTNILEWVQAPSATDGTTTWSNVSQYFSFNAPVGAAADAICGRFVFSDIHVSSGDVVSWPFPTGCTTTKMSAQELALEFMFFDLASRVCDETVPPPPPTCTKTSCGVLGLSCGSAADGCGGLLSCGTCTPPDTCGGSGAPGKCGHPMCTPKTCAAQGIECGAAGDGCGNLLDCGKCTPPQTCGGGGTPYKCGGVK
ncbi:MAG: hypothetical protein ACXVEF_22765 [Polyangiales bacterium]